jgi:hypothetical protein
VRRDLQVELPAGIERHLGHPHPLGHPAGQVQELLVGLRDRSKTLDRAWHERDEHFLEPVGASASTSGLFLTPQTGIRRLAASTMQVTASTS